MKQLTEARIPKRVNLWRLKEETKRKSFEEKVHNLSRDDVLWDSWCESLMKIAVDVCGMTKGCHKKKTTWWWTKEIVTEVHKKQEKLQKMAESEDCENQERVLRKEEICKKDNSKCKK